MKKKKKRKKVLKKTKNLHHPGLVHLHHPDPILVLGQDPAVVHPLHLSQQPILVQAQLSQIRDITPGPGKREGGKMVERSISIFFCFSYVCVCAL